MLLIILFLHVAQSRLVLLALPVPIAEVRAPTALLSSLRRCALKTCFLATIFKVHFWLIAR